MGGKAVVNAVATFLRRFKGAVKSGNRAAYLGIFLKGVRPATNFLDRIIPVRIGTDMNSRSLPPILMIVSPPRSGSTITYQVLTRVVPCVYLSNLHYLFPRHASSFMLQKKLFGKNISGFKNYYGYTAKINDVNECNEIVADFFSEGFEPEQIRKRFLAFLDRMKSDANRPLIFKNVRAYRHILNLHQAVPELIFLRIKRKTEMVVSSEYKAFLELGYFHPVPPELESERIRDPLDFCVRQVLTIEKSIDRQKQAINDNNWLEWTYEGFCETPLEFIDRLAKNSLHVDPGMLHKDALREKLRASIRPHFDEHTTHRIRELIQKYEDN